jgi:hypothetical protein
MYWSQLLPGIALQWPRNMLGAVFDGRYVYLMPSASEQTTQVASRFDTQATFDAPASWLQFDLTSEAWQFTSFRRGAFDGRYIYLMPACDNPHGVCYAARYDTQLTFTDKTAWSLGFEGDFIAAVFDGRYVYFVPSIDTTALRYDPQKPFDDPGSIVTFDIQNAGMPAPPYPSHPLFGGAAFDGRWNVCGPWQTWRPALAEALDRVRRDHQPHLVALPPDDGTVLRRTHVPAPRREAGERRPRVLAIARCLARIACDPFEEHAGPLARHRGESLSRAVTRVAARLVSELEQDLLGLRRAPRQLPHHRGLQRAGRVGEPAAAEPPDPLPTQTDEIPENRGAISPRAPAEALEEPLDRVDLQHLQAHRHREHGVPPYFCRGFCCAGAMGFASYLPSSASMARRAACTRGS